MTTFLREEGGYRYLRAYRVAEVVYDVTFYFAKHFLEKGDRTVDQMIQAARSGKQNIAEGSEAGTTSKETEIKLTNVAKASLEELLIDYQDYLRVRGLAHWEGDNPRFLRMREYIRTEQFMREYARLLPRMNDEEMANMAITLVHQTIFLLRRLIATQQDRFLKEGGIREQMTRARLEYREKQRRGEV